MAKTTLSGKQITDGSVQRADVDVTTVGQALIAKIIQGTNLTITGTGADSGTGDVTVNVADSTGSVKGVIMLTNNLGGTATSPKVVGITETSGPTTLTIGSIADGQILKRVGSTLVGGAAGAASYAGLDIQPVKYFSNVTTLTAGAQDFSGQILAAADNTYSFGTTSVAATIANSTLNANALNLTGNLIGTNLKIGTGTLTSTPGSPSTMWIFEASTAVGGGYTIINSLDWTPPTGAGGSSHHLLTNQMFQYGTQNAGNLYCVNATCTHRGSGSLSAIIGFDSHLGNQSGSWSAGGGSLGQIYHFWAESPVRDAALSPIGTSIGLKIDDQSGTNITLAYGIYQLGTNTANQFDGLCFHTTNTGNLVIGKVANGGGLDFAIASGNYHMYISNDNGIGGVSNNLYIRSYDGSAFNNNAVFPQDGGLTILRGSLISGSSNPTTIDTNGRIGAFGSTINTGLAITLGGSVGPGGSSYNNPTLYWAGQDSLWSFGMASDSATAYWMQINYVGSSVTSRGFRLRDSGTDTTTFCVDGTGNCGIGLGGTGTSVTAPTAKLDVLGKAKIRNSGSGNTAEFTASNGSTILSYIDVSGQFNGNIVTPANGSVSMGGNLSYMTMMKSVQGYGQGVSSVSVATPGVITTTTTHPFAAGDAVQFTSTGSNITFSNGLAVPTQVYWVTSTSLTSTTFTVAASPGGTALQVTGAGGGTRTVTRIASIRFLLGDSSGDAAISAASVSFGSTILYPGSTVNHLELRNGVIAQQFDVYNKFTASTDYTRLKVGSNASNIPSICSEQTGVAGNNIDLIMHASAVGVNGAQIQLGANGTTSFGREGVGNFWQITTAALLPVNTNSYDIGASGNTVRDIYIGRNLSMAGGMTTSLSLVTGTATVAPLHYIAGTNKTTVAAGDREFDGSNHYATIEANNRAAIRAEQYFKLTAAGATVGTTIGNYFGTTSNITLVSGAHYEIEIEMYFLKTTAGTVTWTFTNSAAPTSMNIYAEFSPIAGISATGVSDLSAQVYNSTSAAQTLVSGTLATGVSHYAYFRIVLQNNTGTSLKIQATNSAGTITPGIGSMWKCRRLSTGNVGTFAA